jgi:hypothetical protein
MPDLMKHLAAYWHLWTVAAVLGLIGLHYLFRFVIPALVLKNQFNAVNSTLGQLATRPAEALIDLTSLQQETTINPALHHAWQQYARTLQTPWQNPDAGPIGAARQRVSQLSGAFFAHMNTNADGGRLDLSAIERLAQTDAQLATLWQEYNQAVETLQQLETSTLARSGPWQASSYAEHYFTEQALVDSPLQTHFFSHIPGILTGVGIIGTFTGLIAGLIGFDVSQPQQVQNELTQLVQTVGHAFLVSAMAITLAMVFTWFEKSLLTGRYRQVEQLQHHLDTIFAPHGGEQHLERLTLATEMQTRLSLQILQQLRATSPTASQR